MTREDVGALVAKLLALLSLAHASAYVVLIPRLLRYEQSLEGSQLPFLVLGGLALFGFLAVFVLLWAFSRRFASAAGLQASSTSLRRKDIGLLVARGLAIYVLFRTLHQLFSLAHPWHLMMQNAEPVLAIQAATGAVTAGVMLALALALWFEAPKFGRWVANPTKVSVLLPERAEAIVKWKGLAYALLGATILLGSVPEMVEHAAVSAATANSGVELAADEELQLRWQALGTYAEGTLGLALLGYASTSLALADRRLRLPQGLMAVLGGKR
jgi:hypothetical protein